MSGSLKDLSAQALVAAIRANLFEWWRYLGSSPKAELYDSPELTWLLTGIPHSFVNSVLRTQAEPDNVDAIIEKTLAHFRSKDVTKFSWWTEPGTQPTDLGKHLMDHGLTHTDGGPGMAADLLALNEGLPTPTGLTIEHVEDTEALRKWAYASMIGFELPETSVNTWFDLFTGLGFDLPLRNYLGILNGEPVAASELFLGAGVAGIYVVATIPDVIFRAIMGQGFSPRLGHWFSAMMGHSFAAKLGHDGTGETLLSRAYFRFSELREQEELCPERGKRPWRSERC